MIIKKFSEQDLKPVAKLCRLNMEYDTMPDFLLREKTFGDVRFDPRLTLIVAEQKDSPPIGFIQGVFNSSAIYKTGYIKLLCVESNYRRKGIAAELYKRIERLFIEEKVTSVRVYECLPNFLTPGIDERNIPAMQFFERQGFKRVGESFCFGVDLVNNNFNYQYEIDLLKSQGVSIFSGDEVDKQEIMNWVEKVNPMFKENVKSAIENNPPSVIMMKRSSGIAAVSLYEANNKGTGTLGPVFYHPELADKLIIIVSFGMALKGLKNLGYQKAIAPTCHNSEYYTLIPEFYHERKFFRYEKIME